MKKKYSRKHISLWYLPDNRELLFILLNKEHPPNIIIKPSTIKTSLIEDINKKDSNVVYFMNTAQKTINSHYPDERIYTDGSAFKGIMNAGYGSHVQISDQSCEELFEA